MTGCVISMDVNMNILWKNPHGFQVRVGHYQPCLDVRDSMIHIAGILQEYSCNIDVCDVKHAFSVFLTPHHILGRGKWIIKYFRYWKQYKHFLNWCCSCFENWFQPMIRCYFLINWFATKFANLRKLNKKKNFSYEHNFKVGQCRRESMVLRVIHSTCFLHFSFFPLLLYWPFFYEVTPPTLKKDQ